MKTVVSDILPSCVEVCVDSADGLAQAILGGADRIELCSALELGGLTPSPGLLAVAAQAPVPVYAMIRPRPGDFVFSERDLDAMLQEIDAVRAVGLAGVVLGANLKDGQLDFYMLRLLGAHARAQGLGTTLHRAFDLVPNLKDAIEAAIELRFERILTSGRATRAIDGVADLAQCLNEASGQISIMPGAGLNQGNVGALVGHLNNAALREVHGSCSMSVRTNNAQAIQMGFTTPTMRCTDAMVVREFKSSFLAARSAQIQSLMS